MFNRKHLISELTVQFLRALTIVLICGGVIWFASQKITDVGSKLEEKRTGAVILENKSKSIQKLKQDFDAIGNNDQLIENGLINIEDISEFINVLENLAVENNAKQTLKFSLPTKLDTRGEKSTPNTSNIYNISYTISLTANVYDLITYMEAFEKLPYFTEISGVTISSPLNWENDSSISIQAKLYAKQ